MRRWQYFEPGTNGPIIMTDKEIIDIYWDSFVAKAKASQKFKDEDLTHEMCIQDWVVIFWADEIKVWP